MIIFLDPGHGETTPGKRSPDGKLREYKYCREIANNVKDELTKLGYEVHLTVEDNSDMPLSKRCKIINDCCTKVGNQNVILVSIHCNAAGSGAQWMNAKGWSVFVSNNSSTKSIQLAKCLYEQANKESLKLRPYSATQSYWKQNLAMCRDTHCPAILVENLFQDNKEDVAYLLSDIGKKTITNIHVNGILEYLKIV